MKNRATTIVHITTIPQSLYAFFEGQFGYMQRAGFEVIAISSPGEWLDAFAKREGVRTIALEMTRKMTPLKDLLTIVRLCRLLWHLRPDIVHAHTPKAGLLGTVAAWLTRVPVRIYHIHGLPFMTASGWRGVILKLTERLACTLATRVLCVSTSIMRYAVAQRLCAAPKIKTLLGGTINGINATGKFNPERFSASDKLRIRQGFQLAPDSVVLGFVGRIVRDKGIVELCKAWELLRAEFPKLELLLVGPFENAEYPLPAATRDFLRSDPRIHLAGLLENPVPAYAVIDLLVLPTYREGFGLAAIEASAMEVPVVATNIPGCVDAVVHGTTGLLIPPCDVAALHGAIRDYLRNPLLREAHGRSGRQRVLSGFSQEKMWAALRGEYADLLLEHGGARAAGRGQPFFCSED